MSHKMLRPFIVKVSVLGYYPLCIPVYVFPHCNKQLALFPYMKILIIYLPCKHNTF